MYYTVNPFGEERADIRAAQIICWLANASGNLKNKLEVGQVLPFLEMSEYAAEETLQEARDRRGSNLEKKFRVYATEHNWWGDAERVKKGRTEEGL